MFLGELRKKLVRVRIVKKKETNVLYGPKSSLVVAQMRVMFTE